MYILRMARPERKRSEKKYIKWNIEHGMTNPTTKNKYKKIYHIQKNSYMHIYAYCTFCVVLMYIHDIAPTVYYYYEVNDVSRNTNRWTRSTLWIRFKQKVCQYVCIRKRHTTLHYYCNALTILHQDIYLPTHANKILVQMIHLFVL